jgi:glycopeptide antibiotics resistance protein
VSDQIVNAVVAIALGGVAAVVLLIPVAAYQYRLDGRLGPGDLAVLVSGAVYGLALWTYTLLPVPPAGDYRCRDPRLTPLGTIGDLSLGPPGAMLRDPAVLQVVLNVLLFVPLGYYVRQILRRGVVVATVIGLATSLLIETTQYTGVWHLYRCAYRELDVDDLLVNTLGALVGSLLSLLVVRRRDPARPMPTRITAGRRLVGMLADLLFLVLLGGALVAAYRAWCELTGPSPDAGVQVALQLGVPFAVEAASVLLVGRTVGDHVVSVRAVVRRGAVPLARLVKLATGVGPIYLLLLLGGWWAGAILPAYLVLTALAALPGPDHRGLSNRLAGMELVIAAEERIRR